MTEIYSDVLSFYVHVHNIRNSLFGLVTCSTALSLTVSKRVNRARVRVKFRPCCCENCQRCCGDPLIEQRG